MKLPLSICTIIKNEEKNLPTFLDALKRFDLLDHLVLTDTGSEDKSLDILGDYGITPLFLEWPRDFARAKNFCVSKAGTDWILLLDADEFLREFPEEEVERLIFAERLQRDAPPPLVGRILRENDTPQGLRTERITRLFHRGFYRYEGRIHEQLVCSFLETGMDKSPSLQSRLPRHTADLGIRIEHTGYQEGVVREKALRDKELLELELKGEKDPFTLSYLYYQTARCCRILKEPEEARRYYEKALPSLSRNAPLQTWERDMLDDYGYTLLELKEPKKALLLENYFDEASSRADYLLVLGLIYMENGRLQDALNAFLLAKNTPDYAAEGANTYLPAYNSGVILECAGDLEGAKKAYLSCGEYAPAKEGLRRLK